MKGYYLHVGHKPGTTLISYKRPLTELAFFIKGDVRDAIHELRAYKPTNALTPYYDVDVFSALQLVRKPERIDPKLEFVLVCIFALGYAASLEIVSGAAGFTEPPEFLNLD